MELTTLLQNAVDAKASDIFIIAGQPVSYKIKGSIYPQSSIKVMPDLSAQLIHAIYAKANRSIDAFLASGDDDFSLTISGLSRFRVNVFRQRGSMAAVIRIIMFGLPNYKELNIPENVMSVSNLTKGLVLLTGPAGSGKTTSLACIIDRINTERSNHIITLEDPIEFLHPNKNSIITQREIKTDTQSYLSALRASLRQAPNVVLLGEMRDLETMRTAITAAETGHLIISTLHTSSAVNTIDRIIDTFPSNQQQQIRLQLSMVLQSVICQQLVPAAAGGNVPAFEVMHVTPAIRNMIREAKTHQINSVINASASEGMCGMDNSLIQLFSQDKISRDVALQFSHDPEFIAKKI